MTSWWLFPPNTKLAQFDEKWSFVGKKEKHCDRAKEEDDFAGDHWDHVAFDPEHRLVVSLVCGRRSGEHSLLLVQDFARRTAYRPMDLFTSDEFAGYSSAILEVYGREVKPRRRGKRGRHPKPRQKPGKDLLYATVHKTRQANRVVDVQTRVVYGSKAGLKRMLKSVPLGTTVNTSYVERYNGTDRNRNSRKVRKTYCFSKDWEVHEAVSCFTIYSYNFCWPVRTLRQKTDQGRWQPRTPAMAAGLADHVWSLKEWLSYPGVQR